VKVHRVELLGLPLADLDVAGVADWVAARGDAAFGYVVTPNADHLVRLRRERRLWPVYAGAALCVLDSRVVAGVGRLLGLKVPAVCPGSDLAHALLARHTAREQVTIIGLRQELLPALMARFGLAAPAHFDPPMGFWRDPAALRAAVDFVCAHPSRLVFLAVGSPGQEILASAIAADGRAMGTGLCVGAGLDFLAGGVRRAPVWMRRLGLEWLHRLACEPRRLWRRYLLDDPLVFALLWRARWQGRQRLLRDPAE
jgi:N-acetylglucosaminyldiphosphoundecaprenol N-acetyl-beta-D-mannosaminyltransferase